MLCLGRVREKIYLMGVPCGRKGLDSKDQWLFKWPPFQSLFRKKFHLTWRRLTLVPVFPAKLWGLTYTSELRKSLFSGWARYWHWLKSCQESCLLLDSTDSCGSVLKPMPLLFLFYWYSSSIWVPLLITAVHAGHRNCAYEKQVLLKTHVPDCDENSLYTL